MSLVGQATTGVLAPLSAGSTSPPSECVWYRVLGPLRASRGAEPESDPALPLGPPKQRVVLALLVLARGRVVPRERLVEALWGEHPPPSAVASLQAYVSNLRRTLRGDGDETNIIEHRADGYVLHARSDCVDLFRLQQLAEDARHERDAQRWPEAERLADRALALCRRTPLEDLADRPAVRAALGEVEELLSDCRETRIAAHVALGGFSTALLEARALRAARPSSDRAAWLLMTCLHRAGRSAEALELYREHARTLDEDLGLQPSSELRALQVAILRHDVAAARWPRGEAAPPEPTGRGPTSPGPPARESSNDVAGPLVGREPECRLLAEVVSDASAGHTRWLVINGPTGIGKTRLAQELVTLAQGREGAIWIHARAGSATPVGSALRQLVSALGADLDSILAVNVASATRTGGRSIAEHVAELIEERAGRGRPLTVVIDDLQDADAALITCLTDLASALREVSVILALTLCDVRIGTPLSELIGTLARTDGLRQLRVRPLSAGAGRELATSVAHDPLSDAEHATLARRTGGNPLLIVEWARLTSDERRQGDLPLAVQAIVERRLDGLRPEVRKALRVAAAIGDRLDPATVAACTGDDPAELLRLLDDAAGEGLLTAAPDALGYVFDQDLMREGILAAIPEKDRRLLHLRIARALQSSGEGPERVIARARHLEAAAPVADAAETLRASRAAAQVAFRHRDFEAEATWWAQARRALRSLPARPRESGEYDELLVAQMSALGRAGRGQTALDVLGAELVDVMRLQRTSTAGAMAAALLHAGGAWAWTAYGEDPDPLLDRLATVERFVGDDASAHARALAALAVGRCHHSPDPALPRRLAARAVARARETAHSDVLADALHGRLIVESALVLPSEVIATAEELIALARDDPAADAVVARTAASQARFVLGDLRGAEADLAAAISGSERLRLPTLRLQQRYLQSTFAAWRGDRAESARHYGIAGRTHSELELSHLGSRWLYEHSLAWERETLDRVSTDDTSEPLAWAAAISAAQGRGEQAGERARSWLEGLEGWIWITVGHAVVVADVATRIKSAELAERLLELLEPYGGQIATTGYMAMMGPVDLARGRLCSLLGRRGDAVTHLSDALALSLDGGGRRWAERSRRALAQLSSG